ncbi:MAG: methylmalonyl Co-A mutase-associated GTPase MeaB, partial [Pseudomonadota bacterium]|nr:methylmalonyl Co-A mutase-associated GTPase MeaB [Pseudomonadota bacterium]
GVGQSETMVAEMTDMFLLLLLPAGGDELQGIKRGIMELADLVAVNKADGELQGVAGRAAADYQHALHLLRNRTADWEPPVMTCSALENRGVEEIWEKIVAFRIQQTESGALEQRRIEQRRRWLWNETSETLLAALSSDRRVREKTVALEDAVADGSLPASVAAHQLVNLFLGTK